MSEHGRQQADVPDADGGAGLSAQGPSPLCSLGGGPGVSDASAGAAALGEGLPGSVPGSSLGSVPGSLLGSLSGSLMGSLLGSQVGNPDAAMLQLQEPLQPLLLQSGNTQGTGISDLPLEQLQAANGEDNSGETFAAQSRQIPSPPSVGFAASRTLHAQAGALLGLGSAIAHGLGPTAAAATHALQRGAGGLAAERAPALGHRQPAAEPGPCVQRPALQPPYACTPLCTGKQAGSAGPQQSVCGAWRAMPAAQLGGALQAAHANEGPLFVGRGTPWPPRGLAVSDAEGPAAAVPRPLRHSARRGMALTLGGPYSHSIQAAARSRAPPLAAQNLLVDHSQVRCWLRLFRSLHSYRIDSKSSGVKFVLGA